MPEYPSPATRNVLEANCSRCPALVDSRETIAWGNGTLDAEVMVVGEAPGAGDPSVEQWQGGNWTGLAYTARHSGRIVRSLFEALGFGPDDLYVTNAVKCFPADGSDNRPPTAEERRTCFTHLETELDQVEPTVVVATGKHATRSILEPEGKAVDAFIDAILSPIDCPTLGVTLVPVLHPAYQHVWLSRLGYDETSYRAELQDVLTTILE